MKIRRAASHTGRAEVGDAVLAAAETTDTKTIAKKLNEFRKAHTTLGTATGALTATEEKVTAAEQAVAEADNEQDDSIDPLADALVGIGQARTQPFKGLSSVSPSKLKEMGYADEAKELLSITAKVRKRKGLTKAVTDACKRCERAAKDVIDALKPIAKLKAAETAARTRRDALTQPWETAFSALKRAAKSAEDDGAKGVFDTLFRDPSAKPAKKKPAKKTKTPAPPA